MRRPWKGRIPTLKYALPPGRSMGLGHAQPPYGAQRRRSWATELTRSELSGTCLAVDRRVYGAY